jgi:NADH-quinone oxidoreductase subunit G
MADGVVWLPTNSPGSTVRRTLGVTSGGVVSVTPAHPAATGSPTATRAHGGNTAGAADATGSADSASTRGGNQ